MAYMAAQMDRQIEGAISENERLLLELDRLSELLRWAYSKLHMREFGNMDDALKLDEMKLYLEFGV